LKVSVQILNTLFDDSFRFSKFSYFHLSLSNSAMFCSLHFNGLTSIQTKQNQESRVQKNHPSVKIDKNLN